VARGGTSIWALLGVLALGCSGSEASIFSPLGPTGLVGDPASGGLSGAGGSASGGSGTTGGITGAAPEKLRSDVAFDWPQTLPGGGCDAGVYTGSFECMLGFFPLQGSMSFILDTSNESGVLEISQGEIVGLDAGGVELMRGNLVGTVRCDTETFDASSVDGRSLPTIPLIPIPAFDAFDATFDGDFDTDTSVISGAWLMKNASSGLLCEGTFAARRSPS